MLLSGCFVACEWDLIRGLCFVQITWLLGCEFLGITLEIRLHAIGSVRTEFMIAALKKRSHSTAAA